MDNNSNIKVSLEDLFTSLKHVKKSYKRLKIDSNDILEDQLKGQLYILRTDKENEDQFKEDTWC